MSLRLRLLDFWLRRVEKPALARLSPQAARARFAGQAWMFRDPAHAWYRDSRLGGVSVTWAEAGAFGAPVILWLHGGAYLMGGAATHRAMLARLAAMSGTRACLPEFRLAPEHPFPAALSDVEAVWDGLRHSGLRADQIVLGGDSSGGGLALALLARLLKRGERPAALLAMSPWADLTASSASLRENARAEALLPVGRLEEARDCYLAGADPRDPGVSPLFADFPDCPPVWLHVGQTEILRDDTLRMTEHLRGQGAEVSLDLWADLPHVVAIFQGWLPEADAVLRGAAGFIRARFP
ncbi:alpha/beta hydrolase fold domain-containing protein [Pseudooceanicola sp.]|uniref:alpha/beta hydrolase fold domain-containing protein n=1 Tax=Pseudooceanicola sp. TaxID=1914328 RepID=UPI00260C0D4A|nr:alpha/beta hydrolase fold domain-containing protein [Pseudooceanicola sp.]MDF1856122.1 alpha/beta hydrolase fold domain-containing protein [Pseudooceanicola sp.]